MCEKGARLSSVSTRVEFSAHGWTKNMADVAHERARVAHAGLRNGTIPKLDLGVLDYYVCVSDSLRLVCLPPGAANHIAAAPKAIPE